MRCGLFHRIPLDEFDGVAYRLTKQKRRIVVFIHLYTYKLRKIFKGVKNNTITIILGKLKITRIRSKIMQKCVELTP